MNKQTGFTLLEILLVFGIAGSIFMIAMKEGDMRRAADDAAQEYWDSVEARALGSEKKIIEHLRTQCLELPPSRGLDVERFVAQQRTCGEKLLVAMAAQSQMARLGEKEVEDLGRKLVN